MRLNQAELSRWSPVLVPKSSQPFLVRDGSRHLVSAASPRNSEKQQIKKTTHPGTGATQFACKFLPPRALLTTVSRIAESRNADNKDAQARHDNDGFRNEAEHAHPDAIRGSMGLRSVDKSSSSKLRSPFFVKRVDEISSPVEDKWARQREQLDQGRLEKELDFIARNRPQVHVVQSTLGLLFEKHGVRPSAAHYEAMILANCDADHGCVDSVKALLDEMERENIALGASICHAVLKVLAVHPDHRMRSEFITAMKDRWITPIDNTGDFLLAGLVRDGQLELAMDQINNHAVWVYVSLLHELIAASDFAAVRQYLYHLDEQRVELSPLTWLLVLEAATRASQLGLVRYIWTRQVEPKYTNPPTGVCYEILLMASREGDVRIAESVMEVLTTRESETSTGSELNDAAWDMLGEAYENAGDLAGAAKVASRRTETTRR